MVISKKHAQRLIRAGKAEAVDRTTTAPRWAERAYGDTYVVLLRHDLQRIDHYLDKPEF